MKKVYILMLAALTVVGCGHKVDREKLMREIQEHEEAIDYTNCDADVIDSVNNMMIDLYRQFYTAFPDDTNAVEYMFQTSNRLIALERNDEAVALLDSIITMYPDYSDMGGCWFMKGYAYENAEQFDSAREAYTYFIENYPDHYLAESTRSSLQYLGMSAEEMFDAIMNAANDKGIVQ